MIDVCIGLGQDSHAFEARSRKPLMLCGVRLPGRGMRANSDGDVCLHALCNALSSALGGGSIATWADELCRRGITDSARYLEKPLSEMRRRGYTLASVSLAIECLQPRIEPYSAAMRRRLARLLGIAEERVGITATSGERLTSFGLGKGIHVIAVAALLKHAPQRTLSAPRCAPQCTLRRVPRRAQAQPSPPQP